MIDMTARRIVNVSNDCQPHELRVYFHYMSSDKIRAFLNVSTSDEASVKGANNYKDAPHYLLVAECMRRYTAYNPACNMSPR